MSEHTHHMLDEVERLQREGRREAEIRTHVRQALGEQRHARQTSIKTFIGGLIGR